MPYFCDYGHKEMEDSLNWHKSCFSARLTYRQKSLLPTSSRSRSEEYHLGIKTCIYGLGDASRSWYLSVRKQLTKLKVRASKNDPAIFS